MHFHQSRYFFSSSITCLIAVHLFIDPMSTGTYNKEQANREFLRDENLHLKLIGNRKGTGWEITDLISYFRSSHQSNSRSEVHIKVSSQKKFFSDKFKWSNGKHPIRGSTLSDAGHQPWTSQYNQYKKKKGGKSKDHKESARRIKPLDKAH